MKLARGKRHAQWATWPQQMGLADDLVYVPGAQALGQWGGGLVAVK